MDPAEKKLRALIRNIILRELKQQSPQDTVDQFTEPSTSKKNLVEDEAYEKLFKSTLSKFGVSSPDELDDTKKKEFFNQIDAAWNADKETDIDEARIANDAPVSQEIRNKLRKDRQFLKWAKDQGLDPGHTLAMNQYRNTEMYYSKYGKNETTSSGAAGPYMTPGAFTRKDQDHTESPAATAMKDWKTTKRIDEQVDFKSEEFSPKQKMAQAIRSVRESLKEVEKVVDKSRMFKEQNDIKSVDMYKRSHAALKKIGEQLTRISNKMQAIK